jgi:hypothetical protein
VTALAHALFRAYVVLFDLPRGRELFPEQFATPEDCFSTPLMLLAERFHHLLAAEDEPGVIVVDSRFREEDLRLRRFFAELTESGAPYVKLDRIVEGLFLGPSHHSMDSPVRRFDRRDHDVSGARQRAGARLSTHTVAAFCDPATGTLDGVGIKRFPDTVAPERVKHKLS